MIVIINQNHHKKQVRNHRKKPIVKRFKIIKKIQSTFRSKQKTQKASKIIQRQYRKFRSYPICAICLQPVTNFKDVNFYCSNDDRHYFHDQCIVGYIKSFSQPYPQQINCPQCRVGNIDLKFNKKYLSKQNMTEGELIKKKLDSFRKNILNALSKLDDLKKSGKFKNIDFNEEKINIMKDTITQVLNLVENFRNQVIDTDSLIDTFKQKNNFIILKNIQNNLDYIKSFKTLTLSYLDDINNLHS